MGTTSQKGELEEAFLSFVPFDGVCSWWAFKTILTFEETLGDKLLASSCCESLSTACSRAAAAYIEKALKGDLHQSH